MSGLLITLHVIICIFIILVVLLQVGRGAELGAAFGSMGQAHNQRGRATFMSKLTATMAFMFMLTSFLLTYDTSQVQQSSVLETVSDAPAVQMPAPAEESAPAEAAPMSDETPAEPAN